MAWSYKLARRKNLETEEYSDWDVEPVISFTKPNVPAASIRDLVPLYSRPHDAWQPMETAPRNGKHCILAVKQGAFIYSVQGAFQDGQWNAVHRDNVEPLCWMPNVLIPAEFLEQK
jgi:hypothetical protein